MIAIHSSSGHFSAGWVSYCLEKSVPFKLVNCFDTDVIQQLEGCTALLWHWEHHDFRAQLFARQLIASVEEMGLLVFPSSKTSWHYDDKVGQKYLLEACGAPLINSYVFYDKDLALEWIRTAAFPKVWKLRGGAGSQNVQLVRSAGHARQIVKQAFGKGFLNSRWHQLRDRTLVFRREKSVSAFLGILRGVFRAVVPHQTNIRGPVQRDYVYFQDFIDGNASDIRVVVVGLRAFAITRLVREGDFRASGSGSFLYNPDLIPLECIATAFRVVEKLGLQCCAFDFVRGENGWLIVEISYAFSAASYYQCPGYWDRSLKWCSASVSPERFIVEHLLSQLGVEDELGDEK